VAAFWPPNGLVVALLVMVPARLRPWVVAAVLPGELVADLLQGTPVLPALGWGTANSLEAVLAAGILIRLARRRPLGDAGRDFYALAVAAIAAPAVGGFLGGAVSYLTYGGPYGNAWLTWWIGDATGILLVVPLVLAFAQPFRRQTALQRLGGFVELGLVVGVAVVVFGSTRTPLEFLILPPLVLLAVRHGLRLTALASLSFSVIATVSTGRDLGPLSSIRGGETRLLALQAFITSTAFVAFLISATMAERRRAEAALAELATCDELTGLANRRRFLERLDELTARRDRSSESAAVAYFDVDGFKKINDGFGHAAGDAVLVEVAHRLAAAVRESDLVARIGGDEFAALLDPVDGLGSAELSARRIADTIEQPLLIGDVAIPIGISVGAALVGRDTYASVGDADRRLYRDKGESRPRPVAAVS
jgi:diguanylate cyclase (GGDEF)-like protein